jgi:hypothetical protein
MDGEPIGWVQSSRACTWSTRLHVAPPAEMTNGSRGRMVRVSGGRLRVSQRHERSGGVGRGQHDGC